MTNSRYQAVLSTLQQPRSVGIVPTDTVYGLVARATDRQAVARLYSLKQPNSQPGTVIAADQDQLVGLGLKARYLKAVEQFWPGAISVVIPCGSELTYLNRGLLSLAVRIPDQADLCGLLRQIGPLLTRRIELSDHTIVTNIDQARQHFNDAVDFYLDFGDLSARKPSTIIRIVDDAVEVLRSGAVTIDA